MSDVTIILTYSMKYIFGLYVRFSLGYEVRYGGHVIFLKYKNQNIFL
mgnify:CR=1 FL=1